MFDISIYKVKILNYCIVHYQCRTFHLFCSLPLLMRSTTAPDHIASLHFQSTLEPERKIEFGTWGHLWILCEDFLNLNNSFQIKKTFGDMFCICTASWIFKLLPSNLKWRGIKLKHCIPEDIVTIVPYVLHPKQPFYIQKGTTEFERFEVRSMRKSLIAVFFTLCMRSKTSSDIRLVVLNLRIQKTFSKKRFSISKFETKVVNIFKMTWSLHGIW